MTKKEQRAANIVLGIIEQAIVNSTLELVQMLGWLLSNAPPSSIADKETETLVFATHSFIKKVGTVPANEIERAINIRKK